MKATRTQSLLAFALFAALTLANAKTHTPPKMKMTTEIPASITTPDKVETRLGM
jgi:hypothetical protein